MRTASQVLPVIMLALALGGYLRFAHLDALEMSADEGASWAAAAEPSLATAARAQRRLNPGEVGLHDITLHYWMYLFGGSLAALRSLSAAAGFLAIPLGWLAALELFAIDGDNHSAAFTGQRALAAALTALLLAVNLVTLKYSRELRMYPLMLALVLAQAACFLRAARAPGPFAYAGTAVFTALAIAAHPMALLAFAGQGVWLLYVIARKRPCLPDPSFGTLCGLFGALAAGVIAAALAALPMLHSGVRAAHGNLLNWVPRPHLWAPLALFNKATGTFAFPVIAALALWGTLRGWRQRPAATVFTLIWMWLPPLALMAASYAIRPVFVERYLLSSFVPLFMLAALGIVELPSAAAKVAATILTVALALGHGHEWSRKPHDTQWREGVHIALTSISAGQSISVAPAYAVNVVRYYLQDQPAVTQVYPADASRPAGGGVLLAADQGKADSVAKLIAQYPRVVARLRGLEVRAPAPPPENHH